MPSRQITILFGLLVLTLMAVTAYQSVSVGTRLIGPVSAAAVVDPLPTITPRPTPAVLIGAGDISVCGWDGDGKTAALVEQQVKLYPNAVVFTAGDNAQSMGLEVEYTSCFEPNWGRFKSRIRPSPGNHDWFTEHGTAYFNYFGEAAGDFGRGYYSYNLGDWHIVSLNSNCGPDGCEADSIQVNWLRADLKKNSQQCTLLYWHHPLWNSGKEPIKPNGLAFWQAAYDAHADVVVTGHDHHYERMAPLGRDGSPDPQGIRPFVVGTGGAWLFDLGDPLPQTEARDNSTYGVIRFRLYPDHYEWAFLPVDGGAYTDSGKGMCN